VGTGCLRSIFIAKRLWAIFIVFLLERCLDLYIDGKTVIMVGNEVMSSSLRRSITLHTPVYALCSTYGDSRRAILPLEDPTPVHELMFMAYTNLSR